MNNDKFLELIYNNQFDLNKKFDEFVKETNNKLNEIDHKVSVTNGQVALVKQKQIDCPVNANKSYQDLKNKEIYDDIEIECGKIWKAIKVVKQQNAFINFFIEHPKFTMFFIALLISLTSVNGFVYIFNLLK